MGRQYRIVFMGTPEFAVPSLQALIDHGEQVVAVVSQPDRPKGRGRKLAPTPVKELALAHGLPLLQPTKIRTAEFLDELHAYHADLFVVTAYGRILPGTLLNLPRLGTINVHGSLLPKYRGAAPVQWAILRGESQTGITIMQMDEGMDTGDILLPRPLAISPDDTAASLATKMAHLGGQALVEALELLKAGKLPRQKQDNSLATDAPPLTKEMGIIDWTRPAQEISCLIRGLDPWPTAHSTLGNETVRFFRPAVIPETTSEPAGTVLRVEKNGLSIATGEDVLLIGELQRDGGKRLPAADFLRGHPITPGRRFTS